MQAVTTEIRPLVEFPVDSCRSAIREVSPVIFPLVLVGLLEPSFEEVDYCLLF